jgi:acetyl esterase
MSNLAYLGSHFLSKHEDPMVSPIRAPNLDSFPPVYLNCGSEDALLPDTLEMTARFGEVGVSTTASIVDGVDHEFLLMDSELPHIAGEWQRMLGWLGEKTAPARAA